MNEPIVLETYTHYGITVLRDDLLPGGTKSVLMPTIVSPGKEYVYATPVYGGFQIALAEYCKKIGAQATIFCAERNITHPNTQRVIDAGATVWQVQHGYLSVVEKHARNYADNVKPHAVKLEFGAKNPENINTIAARAKQVFKQMGGEPQEIFCAIGSGTLVEAILQATTTAHVYGVQVGKDYTQAHERLTVLKHHLKFEQASKIIPVFPSMPNYDLKAWEYCNIYKKTDNVLFWNVL